MSQEFSAENCTDDDEAQRCGGRENAYETHVRAQTSLALFQRLKVIMTRWQGLIRTVRNPYRPELHYMRGPGPKWYAKYQGRAVTDPHEG